MCPQHRLTEANQFRELANGLGGYTRLQLRECRCNVRAQVLSIA